MQRLEQKRTYYQENLMFNRFNEILRDEGANQTKVNQEILPAKQAHFSLFIDNMTKDTRSSRHFYNL